MAHASPLSTSIAVHFRIREVFPHAGISVYAALFFVPGALYSQFKYTSLCHFVIFGRSVHMRVGSVVQLRSDYEHKLVVQKQIDFKDQGHLFAIQYVQDTCIDILTELYREKECCILHAEMHIYPGYYSRLISSPTSSRLLRDDQTIRNVIDIGQGVLTGAVRGDQLPSQPILPLRGL